MGKQIDKFIETVKRKVNALIPQKGELTVLMAGHEVTMTGMKTLSSSAFETIDGRLTHVSGTEITPKTTFGECVSTDGGCLTFSSADKSNYPTDVIVLRYKGKNGEIEYPNDNLNPDLRDPNKVALMNLDKVHGYCRCVAETCYGSSWTEEQTKQWTKQQGVERIISAAFFQRVLDKTVGQTITVVGQNLSRGKKAEKHQGFYTGANTGEYSYGINLGQGLYSVSGRSTEVYILPDGKQLAVGEVCQNLVGNFIETQLKDPNASSTDMLDSAYEVAKMIQTIPDKEFDDFAKKVMKTRTVENASAADD